MHEQNTEAQHDELFNMPIYIFKNLGYHARCILFNIKKRNLREDTNEFSLVNYSISRISQTNFLEIILRFIGETLNQSG